MKVRRNQRGGSYMIVVAGKGTGVWRGRRVACICALRDPVTASKSGTRIRPMGCANMTTGLHERILALSQALHVDSVAPLQLYQQYTRTHSSMKPSGHS